MIRPQSSIKLTSRIPNPFRSFGLAFACGVFAQLAQSSLWSTTVYSALCAVSLILLLVSNKTPYILLATSILLFGGYGSGYSVAGLHGASAMAQQLAPAREGEEHIITGTIAQLPTIGADSIRFVFDIDAPPAGVPERVLVLWHEPADTTHLTPGARFRMSVKLKAVHGTFNHHGFDYELYQLERGIGALASVRPRGEKSYLGDAISWRTPNYAIERLRATLKKRMDEALRDAPYKGVVQALAIGDQSAIEKDDWRVFRDTGVGHLMSISGLHVTMFAWLAGAIVGWLWRRSARLMLRIPAPSVARWSGLIIACAYAAIAGWGVPAQRTVLMLAVSTYALSRGLRYRWFDVLLAALVLVIAFDPWAMLQPGFWLSFSAVGFLFWASLGTHTDTVTGTSPDIPKVARWWQAFIAASHTQAVATLALIPLSVLFFQQISLVSPFANALAIPLISLLVTPIAVLGLLLPAPLASGLWNIAHAMLQALQWVLEWLAQLPFATASLPAPPTPVLLSAFVGTALLVAPAIGALRWAGTVLLLPLFVLQPAPPAEGEFYADFIDIGQGNAVLIRTRSHALLYDTGPAYASGADAGERLILPMLRALGVRKLDVMAISHRDSDHSGGAAAVLQSLDVREVHSSMRLEELPQARQESFKHCSAGQYWQWDNVKFEYLYPQSSIYSTEYASGELNTKSYKPNALSCVLKISSSSGKSVLLVADAESAQEQHMLAQHGADKLQSTVLLMGHHGSKTSSSAAFLDAVKPQTAVVQAGYRSAYGHPHPTVVQRYIDRTIAVRRADCEGGLFWSSASATQFDAARAARWRYWRHLGASHNKGHACGGIDLAEPQFESSFNEAELTEAP